MIVYILENNNFICIYKKIYYGYVTVTITVGTNVQLLWFDTKQNSLKLTTKLTQK